MATRIGYPHVVSTLALVVALGTGSAYAASLAKDSVTTKQIKNGTVLGKDVDGDTITGANLDEASLAKVPSAATADRASSAASADRAATVDSVRHVTVTMFEGQADAQMLQSGPFTVTMRCYPLGPLHSALAIASSEGGSALASLNGAADQVTALNGNGTPSGVAGAVDNSSLHVEITAVTPTHLLYLVGRVYQSGNHCGADLIAIG